MKERVLTFLQKIIDHLSDKTTKMRAFRVHAPFVREIKKNQDSLRETKSDISNLDETHVHAFSATTLYLLLDKIIPIFKTWQNRFKQIKAKHQADNVNHINAFNKFNKRKETLLSLLVEINLMEDTPMIPVDSENPQNGRALIKSFDKKTFVTTHNIDTTQFNHKLRNNPT